MTTLASPEYFERYNTYLADEQTQFYHRRLFATFRTFAPSIIDRVLDLGCGRACHFQQLMRAPHYLGIDPADLDPPSCVGLDPDLPEAPIIRADYRAPAVIDKYLTRFQPTAVVSIFGTELTASHLTNELFYSAIFEHPAAPKAILVAGFWRDKADPATPVLTVENGLPVFQSATPVNFDAPYTEFRLAYPLPSPLFGCTAVEVWRLLLPRA